MWNEGQTSGRVMEMRNSFKALNVMVMDGGSQFEFFN